jgi:trehalose 6-phosphate phosphatase
MTPSHPERPLLFLDYDGTLAPLVDDPGKALPHPAVPGLLARLHEQHPLVIVTGRHLDAVTALFDGPPPVRAVGLHGMQEGMLGGKLRDLLPEGVADALDALREGHPDMDGVVVEEKGPTFALHYRRAADKGAVRRRLQSWADGVPDTLEPVWGKDVLELRPVGTSKGVAVRRIAAEYPGHTPVYLGDDVTDEDAFAALDEMDDAVTVKVGAGTTRARYRLPDVEAVVAYLEGFAQRGVTTGSALRRS